MNKEELLKKQKEIEKQLEDIREIEYKQRIEANRIKLDKLRNDKDFILSLFEHQRTSCSDDYISNGYGSAEYGARCNKCHLIEILNSDYDNEFEVCLDFTITKIYK